MSHQCSRSKSSTDEQVASGLGPNPKIIHLKLKVGGRGTFYLEVKPLDEGREQEVHLGPC